MNNTNKTLDQILTMKGFKHGAGGQPIDPAHEDCTPYMSGFWDGRQAHDRYRDKILDSILDAKTKTRHGES